MTIARPGQWKNDPRNFVNRGRRPVEVRRPRGIVDGEASQKVGLRVGVLEDLLVQERVGHRHEERVEIESLKEAADQAARIDPGTDRADEALAFLLGRLVRGHVTPAMQARLLSAKGARSQCTGIAPRCQVSIDTEAELAMRV